MLLTLLLTLCNIVLLCLMILTATVFMPYRGLAKNFPQDVQEALKPRLDQIDRQPKAPRIFGGILIIIMCLLFVAVFMIGGIEGTHRGFSFGQHLLRFLMIAFGVKAFDIIALDYFLLDVLARKYVMEKGFIKGAEGHPDWKWNGWRKLAVPEHGLGWPLLFCPLTGVIVAGIGALLGW